ncbi:MAG: SET domain-containing protein [Verrucomicrobiales bacterium]|jgi:SET domain-containing protein
MDNPKVKLSRKKNFGQSLFAFEPVYQGELIAAFDGECYSWRLSDRELPNEYPDFIRDHAIQFHPRRARDSKGLARYANHSCEPNCGIRNLFQIVAMRDIPPGEEITWDYAMTENDDWQFVCLCGAPKCRGVIKGFRYLPDECRQKYAGFLSEWLFQPMVGESAHYASRFATRHFADA